jgi:hypothetical protein
VAKAPNKKLKGISLYNKISGEFTKINNTLPEELKLSLKDRRKFIKEKIYPLYKGSPASRVRISSIKKNIEQIIQTVVPKEGCDVNLISPAILDVSWMELDNFIKDVLPSCVFIKINAGVYGSTKMFNTRNYNYTKNNVKNIVDNIREAVDNNSSIDMSFVGVKKLRNRKLLNDGTPENYYIDFILTIDSDPVSDITPVIFNVPKSQKKKVATVKEIMLGRVKQLGLKKNRTKNARKTVKKNIAKLATINKKQKRSKSLVTKQKLYNQKEKLYSTMLKQLELSYKKGLFTEDQYEKYRAEILIKTLTNKKDGGLI